MQFLSKSTSPGNVDSVSASFDMNRKYNTHQVRTKPVFLPWQPFIGVKSSAVSIVTRQGDGRYRFRVPIEATQFYLFKSSETPSILFKWVFFPRVMRPGREVNHIPTSRLRMSEAISLLPYSPSWSGQGKLYYGTIHLRPTLIESRDSSIGIATRYGL